MNPKYILIVIESSNTESSYLFFFSPRTGILYLNPDYSHWFNQWVLWETNDEAVAKGPSDLERINPEEIEFILKLKILDSLTKSSRKLKTHYNQGELSNLQPLLQVQLTSEEQQESDPDFYSSVKSRHESASSFLLE